MKTKSIIYKLSVALLLLVFIAAGCGYKFSGGGTLPSGTGAICIKIFENSSSETQLENTLTNDIIYEFTRNGQTVVRNEASADSVMIGRIISVSTESATRTTNLISVEKKVKVVIGVALQNRKGRILWENNELKYEQTFLAKADDNEAEKSYKKAALVKLSKRFSAALYANMTEDF